MRTAYLVLFIAVVLHEASCTSWRDRSFVVRGDVYIGSILKIFKRNETNACSIVHVEAALGQALLFVDVLRQHDFRLTATPPGGSGPNKTLAIGYFLSDECTGVLDSVNFAIQELFIRESADYCPAILEGKRVLSASTLTTTASTATSLPHLMATIGPGIDSAASVISTIGAIFGMVQLTPIASECLSGCEDHYTRDYLFRVASPSRYEPRAIADLLLHFKWSYFAVVSTGDDIGSVDMMYELIDYVAGSRNSSFCVAFGTSMEFTTEDAGRVVKLLRDRPRAKAVVALLPSKHFELLMDTIWKEDQENESNETLARIWIGWHKWIEAIDLVLAQKKYEPFMQAVLQTVSGSDFFFRDLLFNITDRYLAYGRTLSAALLRTTHDVSRPPWWCRIVEMQNNCSGVCNSSLATNESRCPDNAAMHEVIEEINLPLRELADPMTVLATEATYQVLQNLFNEFVAKKKPAATGEQLGLEFYEYAFPLMRQAISNIKLPCPDDPGNHLCQVFPNETQALRPRFWIFAVNLTGHYSGPVGSWSVESDGTLPKVLLPLGDVTFGKGLFESDEQRVALGGIPLSSCTPFCKLGEGRTPRQSEGVCCYECRNCSERSVSNGTRCITCKEGFQPSKNLSVCEPLPLAEPLSHVAAIILSSLLAGFLLLLIFTGSVFFYYRQTTIVKSADRFLTSLFLVSMTLNILLELVMLNVFIEESCTAIIFAGSMLMYSTLAVLVVKTIRMARIYFSARRMRGSLRRKWSMMTSGQVVIFIAIMLIALVGEILKVLLAPPKIHIIHRRTVTYELCFPTNAAIIGTQVLMGSLILTAIILAFLARKLSLTIHDERLLFMAAFSVAIVWIADRGVNTLAEKEDQPILLILLILAQNFILWVWMVAPRLYILLFRPQRRNAIRMPRGSIRPSSIAMQSLGQISNLPNSTMSMGSHSLDSRDTPEAKIENRMW